MQLLYPLDKAFSVCYSTPLNMVTQQERQEIEELIGTGLSVPQIAREVGLTTTTIYRFKRLNGSKTLSVRKVRKQPEVLKYKEELSGLIKKGIKSITKLHSELQSLGFKGHYHTLWQYLRLNKEYFKKDFKEYKRSIHIETGPGEQAQVDWGHFGKIEIDGKRYPLYCFVYILSFSRTIYIEFTIKQNLKTLEECHKHAFKELGIPKTILYDNMKTVVLSRDKLVNKKQHIHYNPAFLEFAGFYGFEVVACPPYWPRAKGKVEAAVKLVKNNLMQGMQFGRDFTTLDEINEKARNWLKNSINVRKHRTTGIRPIDRWLEEKALLGFPKDHDYETSSFVARYSTKDGLVQYKSNFYSVPTEFSRRKLLVKEFNKNGLVTIKIYYEDKVIAVHQLSTERGKWIVDETHMIKNESTKSSIKKNNKLKRKSKNTERLAIVFTRSLEYYDQVTS